MLENKKNIGIVFLLGIAVLLILSTNTFAQWKGVGVGLIFGEPTGVEIKGWTSGNIALSAYLGGVTAGKYEKGEEDEPDENKSDFITNWSKLEKNFPYKKSYNMEVGGNVLWHFFFFRTRRFPVYIGLGLRFKIFFDSERRRNENFDQSINFGFRSCIGWEWLIKLKGSRWGYFIETSAAYSIDPERMDFGGYTGVRWYFTR